MACRHPVREMDEILYLYLKISRWHVGRRLDERHRWAVIHRRCWYRNGLAAVGQSHHGFGRPSLILINRLYCQRYIGSYATKGHKRLKRVDKSLDKNLGFVNVLGSIVGVEFGFAEVRHLVPGARWEWRADHQSRVASIQRLIQVAGVQQRLAVVEKGQLRQRNGQGRLEVERLLQLVRLEEAQDRPVSYIPESK